MDWDTKTVIPEVCNFKNLLPATTSHCNTKSQNQAWKRSSRSPSATGQPSTLIPKPYPQGTHPDASCTLPEDIFQEDQHGSGRKLSECAQVFEPCKAPGPVESLGCILILSLHSGSCWLWDWVEYI